MTLFLRLVALSVCYLMIAFTCSCVDPDIACREKYGGDPSSDARCECDLHYGMYVDVGDRRSFALGADLGGGRCIYDYDTDNAGSVIGYTWVNETCPKGTELFSTVNVDAGGNNVTTDVCNASALSALGWPDGSTPSYVYRLPDCLGISPWNAEIDGYLLCRSWWPKPDNKSCVAGYTPVSYRDVVPLVTYLNNSRQFSGIGTTVCVPTCATNRDGATGFCDSGLPIVVGCGIGDRCCDYRTSGYVRSKGAGNPSTWVELGLKCDPTNVLFYDSEIDCTPRIVSCAAAGSAIDAYRGGCAIGYSFNSESNECDRTVPQEP